MESTTFIAFTISPARPLAAMTRRPATMSPADSERRQHRCTLRHEAIPKFFSRLLRSAAAAATISALPLTHAFIACRVKTWIREDIGEVIRRYPE
jgi:hypothetical protein